MNTLLSFGLHYPWKRAAVRMLDLKPGDKILDICGGTGTWRKWQAPMSADTEKYFSMT